jgi:hypothetical protein
MRPTPPESYRSMELALFPKHAVEENNVGVAESDAAEDLQRVVGA